MKRMLRRATVLAAVVGVLGTVTVGGSVEWFDLSAAATDSAAAQAAFLADVTGSTADPDRIRTAVDRTALGARGDLAVHLADGRTVGTSHAAPDVVRTTLPGDAEQRLGLPGGTVVLRPVATPGGRGLVETYLPDTDVLGALAVRLALLLAGGAAAVGLAMLAGRQAYRPLIRSVRAVVGGAATIGQGRSGIEIPGSPATEVNQLIGVLNDISRHVEHLIAGERELIADLSHRLRTPLTALRLDSESIGEGAVADRLRHTVLVLERDVDDLIRGAERSAERGAAGCDVVRVVTSRMAFWSTLAEYQGRPCEFTCGTGSARVELSEKDLGAAVDSLLGNIFQHTPGGVGFAAQVVRYAGWITLVVEDAGPGIPDSETALRRGASGRGSTGLGLDIARHAVEATGGTIHIDRGRLGGARIRLRFAEAGAHHRDPAPRAWRLWSRSTEPDEPTD